MRKLIKCILAILICAITVGCTEESSKELTNIAEDEDTILELKDIEVENDIVRVHAIFTNNTKDGLYAFQSFGIKAYQNEKELVDSTDINDVDANTILEVKNGKSIDVSYSFVKEDDSDVEVNVCSPTADEEVIATKVYSIH